MAALPNGDRSNIDRYAQRWLIRETGAGFNGLSAADLRAAINAIDDWADANAAEFNTAIPVAARTALNTKQKTQLLVYVIKRRAELA